MTALSTALNHCLKELNLPTVRASYGAVCQQAVQESYSYEQFLLELLRLESEGRQQRRIERLLRESRLPLEKSLEAFDLARLPAKVRQQVTALRDGAFVERRENVLAFGKPGSGKTHLLCALCQPGRPRRPTPAHPGDVC
jgi:DNA replication protein DnaC